MKIKCLKIKGFRGIRKDINIDLNSSKSILIYGDNGSGKSSITDAIEWFYFDKVEHLSSKEIGAEARGINALRNIFLADDEDAYVELKFSSPTFDSKKSLFYKQSKLIDEYSNSTHEFKDYVNTSQRENLILRYKDLLQFILSTKTEKLEEISEIIGFSEVSRIKGVLKKAANDLKKEIKLRNFDNHINLKQAQIIEQIGQNITDDEHFFNVIRELVVPLNLAFEIKDIENIDNILELIKKPEDKETISLQFSYEKVIENLNNLKASLDNVHSSYKNFHEKYRQISKDKFNKIRLEKLLSEGLSILQKRVFEDEKCPLCLQDKSREELIDELRRRTEELSVFKREKEEVLEERDTTQRFIQNALIEIESTLKEKCLLIEENLGIKKQIEHLNGLVSIALDKIKKISLLEFEDINNPEEFISLDISTFQNLNSFLIAKKEKIITNKKDDLAFSIYSKIFSIKQAYSEIKSLKRAADILIQQQQYMELIYNEFVKRQRDGLCSFLESISKDVNDFYLFMNDSENVSGIELIPLNSDDEFVGITVQFKFHGKEDSPPHKYLSESHLNCLGICLFLASVKAFNKLNSFIILDDVISSFDTGHRLRFARLLVEKFSDYQIFLFTHEKDWFEYVSNMVKGKNWLINKMLWDYENGASLEIPLYDLKERIENKFQKSDTSELGNLIRKYLERTLKDICFNLEVKVKFLFNDQNENRMSNEMLSELKSKLKDRKCELKEQAVFERLNASIFLGNKTSHDSTFSESLGDLKMFYNDVLELENLFKCPQCEKIVSKRYYDIVENTVKCTCGNLNYSWKKKL